MTGWPLGCDAGNPRSRDHQAPGQLELLRQGPRADVESMLAGLRTRRDPIVAGLNALPGFWRATPKLAFYAFARTTGAGYTAQTLADTLLQKAGVACLSRTGFGEHGEGHLRFSYASSRENIVRALKRIEDFLSEGAKAP